MISLQEVVHCVNDKTAISFTYHIGYFTQDGFTMHLLFIVYSELKVSTTISA